MRTIPVHIISGFLGSGKTTAIIRLLEQKQSDECWAIVVNEFGKISIDGQTLQSKSASSSVFDIVGGCICCSAKLYLKENLEKIIETKSFDRIIIEPSGLGGIEMVTEIVATIPNLELMPVICMVDITAFGHLKFQRNLIYQSQIRMADRIVFSKCDLTETPKQFNELLETFKSLFPGKLFCFTNMDIQVLFSPEIATDRSLAGTNPSFIPAHHLNDSNYVEYAFEFEGNRIMDAGELEKCCSGNPAVIRAKGNIHTKNGWKLFNYTLSGSHTEPCLEQNTNKLVVIAEKSSFELSEFRKKLFF